MESEHSGREHSSVLYIPAGPDCRINRDYLRRLRHAFAQGDTPPDFPVNNYERTFRDRATVADLDDVGQEAMGWQQEAGEDGRPSEKGQESCGLKP